MQTVGVAPVMGAAEFPPAAKVMELPSEACAAAGPWASRAGTRMRTASMRSQPRRFVQRKSMPDVSTKRRWALKIRGRVEGGGAKIKWGGSLMAGETAPWRGGEVKIPTPLWRS